MVKILNVTAFVISFAAGIFLVYMMEPAKQQVWIYASPKNAEEIQYKNQNQTCYKPKFEKAACTMFAQDVNSSPSMLSDMIPF
jgi:outer membrane lipoprotein-sorting protein